MANKKQNPPRGQHYLPRNAYLSFFEITDKPGSVYFYQRSKEAIPTNTAVIAKENHIYSMRNEDGSYDPAIEGMLAEVESRTKPILEKLNFSDKEIELTNTEKVQLLEFVTFQIIRTPGFIKLMGKIEGEQAKLDMQVKASSKEYFEKMIGEMKTAGAIDDKANIEDLRKHILEGKYDLIPTNGEHVLGLALMMFKEIYSALFIKKIVVLKPRNEEEFLTSDYPVLKFPVAGPYSGFGFAPVGLPIGKNAFLYLENDDNFQMPKSGLEKVKVRFAIIPNVTVRELNKRTILNAERFIFYSKNNEKVQKIFDESETPKRFYIDSPYSRSKGKDA